MWSCKVVSIVLEPELWSVEHNTGTSELHKLGAMPTTELGGEKEQLKMNYR